jgi:hypothetical protein
MSEKKLGEKEAQLRAFRERRADVDKPARLATGKSILKRISAGDLTAQAVGAKPAAKRAAKRAAKSQRPAGAQLKVKP